MCVRAWRAVFVALMKQYVLRDELKSHMWAGVIIIAFAVCLVGASPMIDDKDDGGEEGGGGDDQLAVGLLLTIGGTFMQSLQYVYEEKMMSGDTKVWCMACACGMWHVLHRMHIAVNACAAEAAACA